MDAAAQPGQSGGELQAILGIVELHRADRLAAAIGAAAMEGHRDAGGESRIRQCEGAEPGGDRGQAGANPPHGQNRRVAMRQPSAIAAIFVGLILATRYH